MSYSTQRYPLGFTVVVIVAVLVLSACGQSAPLNPAQVAAASATPMPKGQLGEIAKKYPFLLKQIGIGDEWFLACNYQGYDVVMTIVIGCPSTYTRSLTITGYGDSVVDYSEELKTVDSWTETSANPDNGTTKPDHLALVFFRGVYFLVRAITAFDQFGDGGATIALAPVSVGCSDTGKNLPKITKADVMGTGITFTATSACTHEQSKRYPYYGFYIYASPANRSLTIFPDQDLSGEQYAIQWEIRNSDIADSNENLIGYLRAYSLTIPSVSHYQLWFIDTLLS